MKFPSSILLPVLFAVLLPACQTHHHREVEIEAALLNNLNLMAAQEIAQEKNGDLPPKHFPTWQAFWHNRFFALQYSSDAPHQGHINVRNIANADIMFIKQRRAELGLPPLD